MRNKIEIEILVNFFADTLRRLITTSSARFSEFHVGNVILLQVEVFVGNIKKTTLARYFIKVFARPSFTQLKVIRQLNRAH